jgi:hypothetical protein
VVLTATLAQHLGRFGLEFRVVDTAMLRELRRTRGLSGQPVQELPAPHRVDRLAEAAPGRAASP